MSKHTTIANHLRCLSLPEADRRLLHLCFLEALGPEGAAQADAATPIGPQSLVAEPAGWIVRGTHLDGRRANTVDASGNILPAPPEAERLASAAPTPAPSPKPPREVVGYRVRDVPERRYVEPDHDGFWRPVKPPKVVTREKAERLRDLAVEWACNSGRDLRFRLVRVTRRQRPDVSAAIAACETALHESEQPGCIAPHVRARIGLRAALAALRGAS